MAFPKDKLSALPDLKLFISLSIFPKTLRDLDLNQLRNSVCLLRIRHPESQIQKARIRVQTPDTLRHCPRPQAHSVDCSPPIQFRAKDLTCEMNHVAVFETRLRPRRRGPGYRPALEHTRGSVPARDWHPKTTTRGPGQARRRRNSQRRAKSVLWSVLFLSPMAMVTPNLDSSTVLVCD